MSKYILFHKYANRSTMLLLCLLTGFMPLTVASEVKEITMELGDYSFSPETLEVTVGTTVRLTLVNTDGITPHNIILNEESSGLNIEVDVKAGKTVEYEFTPTVPGSYTFFCDKKLLFMKSHRERGMEGVLTVLPIPPAIPPAN